MTALLPSSSSESGFEYWNVGATDGIIVCRILYCIAIPSLYSSSAHATDRSARAPLRRWLGNGNVVRGHDRRVGCERPRVFRVRRRRAAVNPSGHTRESRDPSSSLPTRTGRTRDRLSALRFRCTGASFCRRQEAGNASIAVVTSVLGGERASRRSVSSYVLPPAPLTRFQTFRAYQIIAVHIPALNFWRHLFRSIIPATLAYPGKTYDSSSLDTSVNSHVHSLPPSHHVLILKHVSRI